jgi:Fur family peroxide stress response transcriptional regulator
MNSADRQLSLQLTTKKIRPSKYRLKILEFLVDHRCHPTIERIYAELKPDNPGLSKTTVYNTLYTFLDAGLARALSIDEEETRFDIVIKTHGHFKCGICGSIFNFNINPDLLVIPDLLGFKVDDKNVYFKGICPDCLLKIELEQSAVEGSREK